MVKLLEARAGENERGLICRSKHLSCLKEDITNITSSQENDVQHLQNKSIGTGELKETLMVKVDSACTLTIETNANNNGITKLNEPKALLESSIEELDNLITSCLKTRSYFTTDIKIYTLIHKCTIKSREEDNHDLTDVKDDLASFQYTTASECDKDDQAELTLKNIQKDDELHELEATFFLTRPSIEGNNFQVLRHSTPLCTRYNPLEEEGNTRPSSPTYSYLPRHFTKLKCQKHVELEEESNTILSSPNSQYDYVPSKNTTRTRSRVNHMYSLNSKYVINNQDLS